MGVGTPRSTNLWSVLWLEYSPKGGVGTLYKTALQAA